MIETWNPVVQLVTVALAASRVTVLLVDDTVLDYPRGRLLAVLWSEPGNWRRYVWEVLTCQRCLGWWVTLAWTVWWFNQSTTATMIAVPWAAAMVAWWAGGSWLESDVTDE